VVQGGGGEGEGGGGAAGEWVVAGGTDFGEGTQRRREKGLDWIGGQAPPDRSVDRPNAKRKLIIFCTTKKIVFSSVSLEKKIPLYILI
jgi:hypothetical protein